MKLRGGHIGKKVGGGGGNSDGYGISLYKCMKFSRIKKKPPPPFFLRINILLLTTQAPSPDRTVKTPGLSEKVHKYG